MNKATERKLLKLEEKIEGCDKQIASYSEQISQMKSSNSSLKKLGKAINDFIKAASDFGVQTDLTKKAGIKFDKLESFSTDILSFNNSKIEELESKITAEKEQKSKLQEAEKKILELEQALQDAGISNL